MPVIVTTKSPVVEALQDRDALCGVLPKVTLDNGVHVRPDGDDGEIVKLTVPVNPLRAVRVIVWVPDTPMVVLTVTGDDGAMEKSVTWNRMLPVECGPAVELVPVTVTV